MTFSGRYWSRWRASTKRSRSTSFSAYCRYPAGVRWGLISPFSSRNRIFDAVMLGKSSLS